MRVNLFLECMFYTRKVQFSIDTMDGCNMLLNVLIMLIILNICDITAHNDELWSRRREHVTRVTDSTCGQSHAVRNEIFFLYDGSPISDPCIITIINSDLSRHSRTCIKLDNVFIYDDGFQCRNVFRFYYGDYPPKNITKYLSCSDIRHEVCDVDKTAYAVFNSQSSADANIKFQIKVSTRAEYSKRSNTSVSDEDKSVSNSLDSRSPRRSRSSWESWTSWSPSRRSWTSWSPSRRSWTSWSSSRRRSWTSWTTTTSWYSNYKRESAEKKKAGVKAGIIILAVIGGVGVITCLVVVWVLKNDICTGNGQPVQMTSEENPPPILGPTINQGDATTASTLENTGSPERTELLTSDREENITTGSHRIPSAPPVESHEDDYDAPPPAYSSLFPSKEK